MSSKPGRNQPCPCGSNKKYKHCCLRNGEALRSRAQRQLKILRGWLVGGQRLGTLGFDSLEVSERLYRYLSSPAAADPSTGMPSFLRSALSELITEEALMRCKRSLELVLEDPTLTREEREAAQAAADSLYMDTAAQVPANHPFMELVLEAQVGEWFAFWNPIDESQVFTEAGRAKVELHRERRLARARRHWRRRTLPPLLGPLEIQYVHGSILSMHPPFTSSAPTPEQAAAFNTELVTETLGPMLARRFELFCSQPPADADKEMYVSVGRLFFADPAWVLNKLLRELRQTPQLWLGGKLGARLEALEPESPTVANLEAAIKLLIEHGLSDTAECARRLVARLREHPGLATALRPREAA